MSHYHSQYCTGRDGVKSLIQVCDRETFYCDQVVPGYLFKLFSCRFLHASKLMELLWQCEGWWQRVLTYWMNINRSCLSISFLPHGLKGLERDPCLIAAEKSAIAK